MRLKENIADIICKDCACNGVEGCELIANKKSGKYCSAALSTTEKILTLLRDSLPKIMDKSCLSCPTCCRKEAVSELLNLLKDK